MRSLDEMLQEADQSRRLDPASVLRAQEVSPDEAGEAQRLAPQVGLPARVVQHDLPAARQQVQRRSLDDMLQAAPQLGPLRNDSDFLAVARDATDEVQNFIDTLNGFAPAEDKPLSDVHALGVADHARILGKNLATLPAFLNEAFAGIQRAAGDAVDVWANLPRRLFGDGGYESSTFTKNAAAWGQHAREVREHLTAENEQLGFFGQSAYGGAQSIGLSLTAAAVALATRNPAAGAAVMGGAVAGEAYGEARDKNVSPALSAAYAMTQGGLESYFERFQLKWLLGDLKAGTNFGRLLGRQLLVENVTEQPTTHFQDLSEFLVLRPDATMADYIQERPQAALQTMIATTVTAGGTTAIIKGATEVLQMGAKADQAATAAELLAELAKLREASTIAQRNPEQLTRLVEQLAPGVELYVDADTAEVLLQSDLELSPEIQARIEEAVETSTPVRFTAAEYATYLTPAAQTLNDNVRVGRPDAMNAQEAKGIESEFKARLDDAARQAESEQTLANERDQIRQQVQAQIVSTRRFRSDVAGAYGELMADFYTVTAARVGQTPAQLWQQYPIRVQSSAQDGAALEQTEGLDESQLQPVAALAADAGPVPQGYTRFRHFGRFVVPRLDPAFMGTGRRGAEAQRADQNRPDVISLYPDDIATRGGPEEGVGSNEFVVDVPTSQLYDASADPLNLAEQGHNTRDAQGYPVAGFNPSAFERAVRAAGFRGYTMGEGQGAGQARLFDAVPVIGGQRDPASVIPRAEQLPAEMREIETRFADWLANNYEEAVRQYNALPESEGGRILNTDIARELSPDYAANRGLSAAAHEPASWFINKLYDQRLREAPAGPVLFTAGGTGAGKSSGLRGRDKKQWPIIFDTNIARASSGKSKLDKALAAGHVVDVLYVYGDPLESLGRAIKRTKDMAKKRGSGRTVPLAAHVNSHVGSRQAIPELMQAYEGDARVNFEIKLNKEGGAVDAAVEDLPQPGYDSVRKEVESELERQRQEGEVSEAEYQALRGDGTAEREQAADVSLRRQVGREESDLRQELTRDADGRLPGAPRNGTGPIPELVAVAEQYAREAGIDFAPQPVYVEVNESLAHRIAQAYENMQHAPGDPAVAAAYADLIQQTRAQYDALVAAGYTFTFFDGASDPYGGNPWNAIRDLRDNKHMAVFGTYDGYGTDGVTGAQIAENPMLQPTGLAWLDQNGVPRPVTANDLFRAVHDAFGHGLEGAGFRAQGEENAWQAHVRLFTGPAVGAITSETRGQNSWLNYGPHGDKNRTAKLEDTVFAEQKTGLMPEWAWTEGRAPATAQDALMQQARGTITLGRDLQATPAVISLLENADLTTFLHESGHFFFEVLTDIAAREGAPAEIVADVQTLFNWTGFKGTAAEWRAATIDSRRKAHEQFARGFEAYLFEGKAPSQEQRHLFHRFRSWVVNWYKTLGRLNVELTDEVRQVMDRLTAAREQIEAAEEARSLLPLFENAQAANMDQAAWEQYQQTGQDATNNAQDQLQARSLRNLRWLANAKARELAKLQKSNATKRTSVREEVEAEIARRPERVAETLLLTGEAWVRGPDGEPQQIKLPAPHKLSTARLAELYGTTEDYRAVAEAAGMADVQATRAPWHSLPRNLVAKQGLDPAEVAELTGFDSADALVQALLAMEPREQMVERITDQVVLRRYGDLNDAASLERAVDMALHNQMRTRMVATELAALQGSVGNRDALRKAAREFADRLIRATRIRDLRPGKFATGETKAARLAVEALAKGDTRQAAAHKRDQLFNGYANREAARAQEKIEAAVRYLLKFNETGTRKNLEPGYRDQIDKLLERYSFRPASLRQIDKRAALSAWVAEQEEQGHTPVIPDALRDEAQRTHYRNLTVDQFNEIVDAVKNIEHLARFKHKLLVNKRHREFSAMRDELADSLEKHAPKKRDVRMSPDRSLWGQGMQWLRDFGASMRKLSSFGRVADGGVDGGRFWDAFVRPFNDAADVKISMGADATVKMDALYGKLGSLRPNAGKVFIGEIQRSLTREERVAVALNSGNTGNMQRLTEGNRWTPAQVAAIVDTLTDTELTFVQEMWDYIDTFWPQIKAKQERVSGVSSEKVQASSLELPSGRVLRGGYYPIKADPNRSDRPVAHDEAAQAAAMMRGAYTAATTARGHENERKGGTDPVRLDLALPIEHVTQVIHDLAWHETLIDYNKMLRDPQISGLIRDHYGPEYTAMMREVALDSARGDPGARKPLDKLISHFRIGVTISGLGWSSVTSLLQITGVTQSIVRAGALTVARGYGRWAANPVESTRMVYEKSAFMRDRDTIRNRELGEVFARMKGARHTAAKVFFWPIQALQKTVDIPTWIGAYNDALSRGEVDDRAVALADQVVRDSQSAGHIHDLSGVQRGSEVQKLFTNFYSYFNATYQLAVESHKRVGREKSLASVINMATDYLLLFVAPAVLGLLIRDGLRGDLDDKDPEEILLALAKEQGSFIMGMYPFVREFSGLLEGYETKAPTGLRVFGDYSALARQIQQGENDEAFWRALNRAGGVTLHYPAAQIDRTVRGIIAVAEGDAPPQAVLVGPPRE